VKLRQLVCPRLTSVFVQFLMEVTAVKLIVVRQEQVVKAATVFPVVVGVKNQVNVWIFQCLLVCTLIHVPIVDRLECVPVVSQLKVVFGVLTLNLVKLLILPHV